MAAINPGTSPFATVKVAPDNEGDWDRRATTPSMFNQRNEVFI